MPATCGIKNRSVSAPAKVSTSNTVGALNSPDASSTLRNAIVWKNSDAVASCLTAPTLLNTSL